MQRKRRNINFGYFSGSSGKGLAKFLFSSKSKLNNSITKLTLHSIPTVRMSESNKKSYARIEPCPICGKEDIYQPTSVVWWRSAHLKIRTRASHVVMTPLSRLARYLKQNRPRNSRTFIIPFGGIERSSKAKISVSSSRGMTPYGGIQRYSKRLQSLKFPLYIICTLLLSFVVNGMISGFECYAAVNPTASLSVSNPTLSTTVAPGDTAYLSSNVTYSASDIDSYTLQVSYANGYNSLKLDGGTTTLSGAGGKTGSGLSNNSWGFAWTNNTTNNDTTNAGLTYYTVPTYGTNGSNLSTGRLENATLPESANNTLDSTTKRIVFAAKFAENNNNSGHYKTGIQLSMVATPRKLIGLEKANTMQDLATHPEYCEETPLLDGQKYSAEYKLMDNRAYPSGVSNQYTIRKFADGRCWMTENLRINNTTIKATDSDFTGSDIALPSSTRTEFNNTNRYSYRSITETASPAGLTGYYNWYTATAGAGNSSVTTGNQSVNTSICPKGWTLPTGGISGNTNSYNLFKNMPLSVSGSLSTTGNTSWGSDDLAIVQDDEYNFKYTGVVGDGSLHNSSEEGIWWTSTTEDAYNAYFLYINGSGVRPGTGGYGHYYGVAVRCIARDPDLSEITTMQEMTPRVCEKTAVGTSKTLTDSRDSNKYTVRKFADGRCWMTDNLKLRLTTAGLSKDDTDLNQGYDWDQTTRTGVAKPTNTLTSFNTTSGNRDFSEDKGYYAVQSYIASSSNAGETGYYSWNAATAGTGGTSSSNAIAANSQAPSSICPKGWRLPTGGGSSNASTESTWSDYYKLFRNMGLTISNTNLKPGFAEYTNWSTGDLAIVQDNIYNFKYTGRVGNGSLSDDTTYGYWWSSTALDATNAYNLYIYSSGVRPGTDYYYRYAGFAVRCVARDS